MNIGSPRAIVRGFLQFSFFLIAKCCERNTYNWFDYLRPRTYVALCSTDDSPLAIWQGEETLERVRETERDRESSGSALLHLVVSLGLLPHLLDWFCNFIRALDKQPNSKAPLKILWIWLPCLCLSINLNEVWLGEKPKNPLFIVSRCLHEITFFYRHVGPSWSS